MPTRQDCKNPRIYAIRERQCDRRGSGPVVADGMLFINSGYVSLIGRTGNVLLAYGVSE